MKTIFRNLAFGALMAGVSAVSATAILAQDVCTEIEAKQALYKQFTDNYAGNVEKKKIAIDAGKQYIQKYGACADDKQIVDYLNSNIPAMEKAVNDAQAAATKQALLVRFDTAAKSKNIPEMFASGKEILAKEADYGDVTTDVTIALASAGFEQAIAATPTDTYNADTITYAKSAIQKIESGKTPKGWGVWSYNLKPAQAVASKYTDTKAYALGALNYIIGYVDYYRLGKNSPDVKKDALPYFYKSTQFNSFSKNDPAIYQAIGAWYLDEAIKIDKSRQDILKANNLTTDNDETKALFAKQKGYADRAIDAYARAYKYAKDDTSQKKDYVDGLYTRLKELFAFRFDNNTSGVDPYVSSVMSKPLPDPASEVTPVVEETPATTPATTTPTSGAGTSSTIMPAANTPLKTVPTTPTNVTTNTTNAAKTTTSGAKTNVTTTTTTTDATTKKPTTTTKKKGTR